MRRLFILSLLPFLAPSAAAAQALPPVPPTVEQSVPQDVLSDPRRKIVTVIVENDSFGGGTDKNYTSGVRVNVTSLEAPLPALAHVIDRIIPTFEINKTSSYYYSFGQSLYTPRDITRATANPNDRPWAGFLYGSMGMASLAGNHIDEMEATLGIVGPLALGRQAQSFIHEYLTDSPKPEGWSHQLKNEPAAMLAWQRGWPMFVSGRVGNDFWSVKPYVGTTLGNVHTYADTGFTIRLSPYDSRWQDTPIRVRPAMPGTGIYQIPQDKWSWELFSGVEGRAVAHDIFLDGNTFASSYSVEKKNFVADANAGAAVTYKNTRLSYTVVYRTKEFYLQDHPEIFGAVSLGVRF